MFVSPHQESTVLYLYSTLAEALHGESHRCFRISALVGVSRSHRPMIFSSQAQLAATLEEEDYDAATEVDSQMEQVYYFIGDTRG